MLPVFSRGFKSEKGMSSSEIPPRRTFMVAESVAECILMPTWLGTQKKKKKTSPHLELNPNTLWFFFKKGWSYFVLYTAYPLLLDHSPRGFTFTWWDVTVYVVDITNRACPLLFILLLCLFLLYGSFNCILFHKFSRQLSFFPHSVFQILILPYWSFQQYISLLKSSSALLCSIVVNWA